MNGTAKPLIKFLDGADTRLIIPIYQRNYDWKTDNCKQLFNDLVSLTKHHRTTHFFGSIVEMSNQDGTSGEYIIIDGQQRITTIYLLLLSMVKLLNEGKITSVDPNLVKRIENSYLVDEYEPEDQKIRLKPVKNDKAALTRLFGDKRDYMYASNITTNYLYFYNRVIAKEITVDQLFEAIRRLMVIDISLKQGEDDAQLIFESLNSTGLDLTEADKIRNYVLMNQSIELQRAYYEKYWNPIEKNTDYKVSEFVRNYLTFKLKRAPKFNSIYIEFKKYVETQSQPIETILASLEEYSRYENEIDHASTGNYHVDELLQRLNILDVGVTKPYLLALFDYWHNGQIDDNQVAEVLTTIETLVFRRLICNIPTNGLNKIFATLFSDSIAYLDQTKDYVAVLNYLLAKRPDASRLPNDVQFQEGISTKDIYGMNSKNKYYLFNRLENQNSMEHVNVVKNMEEGIYTIEHIMPQTLSDAWKASLGPEYQKVYDRWSNRLANLTLTAYNSKYSNRMFSDKKAIENGFNASGFRMNDFLKNCHEWTEKELLSRNEFLKQQALKLWPYPKTIFKPKAKTYEWHTIDDEFNFTGQKIKSYRFLDHTYPVKTWKAMYIDVVETLFESNPLPIYKLLSSSQKNGLAGPFSNKLQDGFFKLQSNVFLYTSTATWNKVQMLKRLFNIYQIDPEQLSIELVPTKVLMDD
ncbi:MAG: DUF262 domain-containing protein [Lactobacillus sp.]